MTLHSHTQTLAHQTQKAMSYKYEIFVAPSQYYLNRNKGHSYWHQRNKRDDERTYLASHPAQTCELAHLLPVATHRQEVPLRPSLKLYFQRRLFFYLLKVFQSALEP